DFHLGSGEIVHHPDLTREEASQHVPVDISAVAIDARGRAYIPGSSLKGALRSWLTRQSVDDALVESVFGSRVESSREERSLFAGKAEFLDALCDGAQADLPMPHVAHWMASRRTGVSVGVAIDRRTRTAEDKKLFHREYVPPGISFDVVV